jgi:hypothetical protein
MKCLHLSTLTAVGVLSVAVSVVSAQTAPPKTMVDVGGHKLNGRDLHAIVSAGVFTAEGEFLPLPSLDSSTVMELFRRLLLERLHQAERLSERFRDQLLSWVHPGFSVFAGPAVAASAVESLESQARYITRPSLAMDALEKRDDGTLAMQTPPDPRTGADRVAFDLLEWIHRITAHIPDPGQRKGFITHTLLCH